MDVVQVTALLTGGIGAMSVAIITLYRALTGVYKSQVEDAQEERDDWRKQAKDAADTIRAQNLIIERALDAVENK